MSRDIAQRFRRPAGAGLKNKREWVTPDLHRLRVCGCAATLHRWLQPAAPSGAKISVLAVIRKLPRDIQEEVYCFLAKKFGKAK